MKKKCLATSIFLLLPLSGCITEQHKAQLKTPLNPQSKVAFISVLGNTFTHYSYTFSNPYGKTLYDVDWNLDNYVITLTKLGANVNLEVLSNTKEWMSFAAESNYEEQSDFEYHVWVDPKKGHRYQLEINKICKSAPYRGVILVSPTSHQPRAILDNSGGYGISGFGLHTIDLPKPGKNMRVTSYFSEIAASYFDCSSGESKAFTYDEGPFDLMMKYPVQADGSISQETINHVKPFIEDSAKTTVNRLLFNIGIGRNQ